MGTTYYLVHEIGYWPFAGIWVQETFSQSDSYLKMSLSGLIEFYFDFGIPYKDIAALLAHRHSYIISERHLKRILKSCGLFRRKGYTSLDQVTSFILEELRSSGKLHGYRWMHAKCVQNGLHVRKEHVRLILQELDPQGVELRRARRLHRRSYFAKGPNYIWHLDSYDKLKPFGICINGCIDGFSRKIIWMNAFTTSSDPKIIGGYYINAVESLGGCPRIVRGDRGTENIRVGEFQRFLRRNIHDGSAIDSYIEGASTSNQRIESWWGFLRKESMEYYISMLIDLKDRGLFDGAYLDRNLIQFCFMGIIQVSMNYECCIMNVVCVPSLPPALSAGPCFISPLSFLKCIKFGTLQGCQIGRFSAQLPDFYFKFADYNYQLGMSGVRQIRAGLESGVFRLVKFKGSDSVHLFVPGRVLKIAFALFSD